MKTYTLYYHTFPNGKMYFGQTCNDVEIRWGKNGYGYKKQPLMWNAIQKYGWDNIEHRIISTGLDKDEADFQEMFYISAYRTNEPEFGYNMTYGGEGTVGKIYSEESRNKMSEKRKGRKITDEQKKKTSETMKYIHSLENGPFSNIDYKSIWTEERRLKYSVMRTGIKFSDERKNKIREALINIPKSEEFKQKLRKPKQKNKYLTQSGEIKEMYAGNAKRFHPDWILITE